MIDERTDLLRRLSSEGLQASPWSNGPGAEYAAHSHSYDKVLVVSRGSITFGVAKSGDAFGMRPGDRLDLPAGTSHDATVGTDGVECFEAHLPAGTLATEPRLRATGSW
jgi:quercetin dioxygenase-like cupin family protein